VKWRARFKEQALCSEKNLKTNLRGGMKGCKRGGQAKKTLGLKDITQKKAACDRRPSIFTKKKLRITTKEGKDEKRAEEGAASQRRERGRKLLLGGWNVGQKKEECLWREVL